MGLHTVPAGSTDAGIFPFSAPALAAIAGGLSFLLARVDSPAAGRVVAVYRGMQMIRSILWLWLVEGARPDRWDIAGAAVILCGSALIMAGQRGA